MATVRQTIDQIDAAAALGVAINMRCTPQDGWQGNMVSADGRVSVSGQALKFEALLADLFDKLDSATGTGGSA